MKNYLIPIRCIITLRCLFHSFIAIHSQCPSPVWADEFTGSTLDLSKWSYQIGDGCAEGICGWGNNELQYYQESNVSVSGGQLHITAKKERVKSKAYTSGRLRSINKGDWTYGRFEARIKLPGGNGLWPAFWMLPTDQVYGGWPQSGEIDIMEFVSSTPDHVLGTLHYGNPYPNNQFQGTNFYLNSGIFPDAFHDFAIEWEPGIIRWFVDDILYQTKTTQDLAPYNWPFDQRFHFLLNVAVGGNLGGTVDPTIFPKSMDVDFVRVYNSFKPYISGKRVVSNQESNVIYKVGNISNGVSVSWAVPSDATIISGQGTSQITINFGNTSGNVTANFSATCGAQQLSLNVVVEPPYNKQFSFENFDDPATAVLSTYTGTHTEVSNPSATGVNTSAVVGEYIRNSTEQYDVVTYTVSNITDASQYVIKNNKFYMDIYTAAPIGTEILLQLETSTATASNYPTGRHSRYLIKTTKQNQWERIPFALLDRPDPAASNTGVSKMILLFASNSFTGNTYYYDNLDSYQAGNVNNPPSVSITSPANGSSFASGTSISVGANASDSDGTVTQVEFFANGSSIGIDNTSPYGINWTIGSGSYTLTARATDNVGASTISSGINVTGQSGTATSMHVSSIVTGTANAGSGNKFGLATVTILNNLGNPVANATVSGTFSGSYSDSANGVTGSNGTVDLLTSSKLKGNVTVNFCVTNVTHASLVYASSQNVITCTGGGNLHSSPSFESIKSLPESTSFQAYPNPFRNSLEVKLEMEKEEFVSIKVYDVTGRKVMELPERTYPSGVHIIQLDGVFYHGGLYIISANVGDQIFRLKRMRGE